jgi:protein TonB
MDRNKGAIFAIYNRALRSKPLLRGKLTIEMVIAADGSITTAVLLASDLGDSELESRLLTRIRMITFSAAAVAATTLNYSFEFLPG